MRFHVLVSAIPPVPIVRGVWEIYGETKAELSVHGKRLPDMDLLIASTAQYYDLILVAKDKHMQHLPDSFRRENWAERPQQQEE
jgi:predicted nucleic acid-binding protein